MRRWLYRVRMWWWRRYHDIHRMRAGSPYLWYSRGYSQSERPQGAWWMLGKAYQALGDHEQAFQCFLSAHKHVLTDQNVLRELALECLHTKRFDQAAYYCNAAMEFDLNDYTLWPNMAVARMMQGRLDEAEGLAKRALEKLPEDEPAKNVLKIIGEVREGKRPLPEDFAALERGNGDGGGNEAGH
jgi:tetratricopeptide (TPR) repeat protein